MLRTITKFSLKATSMLLVCLSMGQVHATGLMECEAIDESMWQSKEALIAMLESEGWTNIRKVKVDEGCYEAYATTPEGDKVEAYFNPQTLEKLLVARRGKILFEKGASSE